ncbi:MAG: hypothetical protein AAB951_00705 [Patescibacteria group bacterium]
MKPNSTFLIAGTLVVMGGLYWYFFMGTSEELPLTPSVSVGLENPAQTKFQALVSQLQPISFDPAIFSDPNFTLLVNLATPVIPETSGRLDPFAALSGTTNEGMKPGATPGVLR